MKRDHRPPQSFADTQATTVFLPDSVSALNLLLLVLFGVAIVIGIYGLNPEQYVNDQKAGFIALNGWLSAFPNFWRNVTTLGDVLVLLPLLSFLLLSNSRIWAALISSIPLAVLLSLLGKEFFAMPRPASVLDVQQFVVIGDAIRRHSALPSGHTITIFTAATAIAGILLYEKRLPHVRRWVITLFTAASLIALSRVAVGAHWPVDLLLGAILGVFAGVSGVLLTFRFKRWWVHQRIRKWSYLHAAFLWLLCHIMLAEYEGLVVPWLACMLAIVVIFYLFTLKDWS